MTTPSTRRTTLETQCSRLYQVMGGHLLPTQALNKDAQLHLIETLLRAGFTNEPIATLLNCNPRTVKRHRQQLESREFIPTCTRKTHPRKITITDERYLIWQWYSWPGNRLELCLAMSDQLRIPTEVIWTFYLGAFSGARRYRLQDCHTCQQTSPMRIGTRSCMVCTDNGQAANRRQRLQTQTHHSFIP